MRAQPQATSVAAANLRSISILACRAVDAARGRRTTPGRVSRSYARRDFGTCRMSAGSTLGGAAVGALQVAVAGGSDGITFAVAARTV
jgi:hypothetical protein